MRITRGVKGRWGRSGPSDLTDQIDQPAAGLTERAARLQSLVSAQQATGKPGVAVGTVEAGDVPLGPGDKKAAQRGEQLIPARASVGGEVDEASDQAPRDHRERNPARHAPTPHGPTRQRILLPADVSATTADALQGAADVRTLAEDQREEGEG